MRQEAFRWCRLSSVHIDLRSSIHQCPGLSRKYLASMGNQHHFVGRFISRIDLITVDINFTMLQHCKAYNLILFTLGTVLMVLLVVALCCVFYSGDALATLFSALYGKLLVVMGIAFPMAEVISTYIPPSFYEVNNSHSFAPVLALSLCFIPPIRPF